MFLIVKVSFKILVIPCVSTTPISFTCRHENEFGKTEMFVSYNLWSKVINQFLTFQKMKLGVGHL
jgi:hypothetical protein